MSDLETLVNAFEQKARVAEIEWSLTPPWRFLRARRLRSQVDSYRDSAELCRYVLRLKVGPCEN